MAESVPGPGVTIVYDGECPFCARYVVMLRLREAFGVVTLVSARDDHPAANEAGALFDLDQGMAARLGDRWYYGADCMHVLAMASGPSTWVNRVYVGTFSDPRRARLLYPFLRTGRNAALLLLGRRKIGARPTASKADVTEADATEADAAAPGAGR